MITGRCRICATTEVRGTTVCDRCRKRSTQHRGPCAGCRKSDKLLDDNDICRWCREKAQRTCTQCAATGTAVTGIEGDTLCLPCALTRRVDMIIPANANTVLGPLREPLLKAEPVTTRRWLIRTTPVLQSIQDGSIALTHSSLDTLPHPKSVEYLRSLLVATGVLGPDVERGLRRLEGQLPHLLSQLTPSHRTLMTRWTQWAVTPTDTEERWRLCRRLVRDDSLDPADRLAGALIALFAQPLTRIVGLTTARVRETDAGVELRLGTFDTLLLPDPFAQIALLLPRRRRAGTAEQVAPRWLFPGNHADMPLTASALGNRLRRIGIEPRALRLSAIAHLTRELPPSAIAGMLGLNTHTVAQHTLRASGQWANYAADRRS